MNDDAEADDADGNGNNEDDDADAAASLLTAVLDDLSRLNICAAPLLVCAAD